VEIDLQPVRAERNLNPTVDLTGRSIPSHAPHRIISTDPLQRYYETKSGTRHGNLVPGFSFGTILVSHNYRIVLMGLASVSTVGSAFFNMSVEDTTFPSPSCSETEQWLIEGKRLYSSEKKQEVSSHLLSRLFIFLSCWLSLWDGV